MTPPDPADVHTGTDRVELTEDERKALRDASSIHSGDMKFWRHHLHAAVEAIVAARLNQVTELAAEMENPNTEHGTMPGVRMQVRREWAARIRDLASSPEAG